LKINRLRIYFIKYYKLLLYYKNSGLAKEGILMGLTKIAGGNYTEWVDKKPLTYTDWDAGNPAQFSSENCVVF